MIDASYTLSRGAYLEKAMATHSSNLAWKIPWTEEPGRLQSMGSLRVGYDRMTSLSLFTFMRWRRKWQPTPVFLPGEERDGGAWWAAVYGVVQSRTWLKRLSSSSSSSMVLLTLGTVMYMDLSNFLTFQSLYFCTNTSPFLFMPPIVGNHHSTLFHEFD